MLENVATWLAKPIGLIMLSMATSFALASSDSGSCSGERPALCKQAFDLAAKMNETSKRIDDIALTVSVERGAVICIERVDRPLDIKSPEAVSGWASHVQRSLCSVPLIAEFVQGGGEFHYRLDDGKTPFPTLFLRCM